MHGAHTGLAPRSRWARERAGDQLVGGAEVSGRVEEPRDLRARRGAPHVVAAARTSANGRPLRDRRARRLRDELVGGGRPSAGASAVVTRSASSAPRVRSRFARIRSASTSRCARQSRSQAAAEPTVSSSSRSGRHSACHAPGGALVLVGHRRRAASRRGRGRASRAATRADRGDRVPLVRQRRGAAAAGDALAHLADLGLGEQDDVARRPSRRRPRPTPSAPASSRRARADRVPRRAPARRARARRRARPRTSRPGLAERGERARRRRRTGPRGACAATSASRAARLVEPGQPASPPSART